MSHTPHELVEEFPEYSEKITVLKTDSAHFSKLFDEYHEVNRKVHRAETNVEPTSQIHEEELRRTRGQLKDELYRILSAD